MPERAASVREPEPPPDAAEQRARVRFPIQQPSLCQRVEAETNDFWFMASIRDLSQHGVGILVNCTFDPGLFLAIEPLTLHEEFGRGFQCRVVYAREEQPGRWFLGCEFVQPLTERELRAFLQGPA
jgi:hypothetical protein